MKRELASRRGGGISVRLLWDERRNQVVLHYDDEQTGEEFATDVPNEHALDSLDHPNAYRPLRAA
jgi:hypothetical protein